MNATKMFSRGVGNPFTSKDSKAVDDRQLEDGGDSHSLARLHHIQYSQPHSPKINNSTDAKIITWCIIHLVI